MSAVRSFAELVLQAGVIVIVLWTVGASLGVIRLGYCMVAGC